MKDLKFWIAILTILFLLGLVGGMEMRDRELRQHIQNEIN
jgi:cytochrome bd-type quinol oxidase subunit 1